MRVLLTGARGMLGMSIQKLWPDGADELVPVGRADIDLADTAGTAELVRRIRPDAIIHAAAKVGGIAANLGDQSAFLSENLLLDLNVIHAARSAGVRDLVYIGSSCMYPKDYRQPLVEGDVLAAPLEPTNEGYALAKISGSKHCQYLSEQYGVNYRTVVPSNLYGPDDDYSLTRGHLVAAALRKAHDAKIASSPTIDVWGDGTARREFTFVDDVADWLVRGIGAIADWPPLLNIGFGADHSVLDYYRFALEVVGYDCELKTDPSRPAGMQRKLMDSGLARNFGWDPRTGMLDGMRRAYERFLSNAEIA